MKKLIPITLLLRNFSPILVPVLFLIELRTDNMDAEAACANLLAASSLLLMFPLSFENSLGSLYFALGQSLLFVLAAALPFFKGNECLIFGSLSLFGLLVYTVYRAVRRYSDIRSLFRQDAAWGMVENFSRMFYLFIFAILCFVALTASMFEALPAVFLALAAAAAVFGSLNYAKSYYGNTMLLGSRREKALRRIINGSLRSVPDFSAPDDHMQAIYNKVLKIMKDKKPFLKGKFSLDELAEAVYTNKMYLSKAINYFSGRNFCQFANYYRIMHAAEIMKRDRKLKMPEIALMCGFHSVVSFNMAFKLYMNMTPGAYYGVLAAKDKGLTDSAFAEAPEGARKAFA